MCITIDGVALTHDVVADPDRLLAGLVNEVDFEQRVRARLTASYGEPYDYSAQTHARRPMTPHVTDIAAAVTATVGWTPNNCLLNLYPHGGSTMGFHADATDRMQPGSGVAIVSLGAQRVLCLRSTADHRCRVRIRLPHGSLLHMSDEFQRHWQHALPRDDTTTCRVSLTFRKLVPAG